MIVKYKVVDFAKDINQPVKKILEELAVGDMRRSMIQYYFIVRIIVI